MKKLVSTLGLSLALASAANATMYIGTDIIPIASGTKVYDGSTTRDPDVSRDFGYTIKLGAGNLGRAMSEVYYMYAGDYIEYGYDYLPSWEVTNNTYINLKLGINYGANNYETYDYYGSTYSTATDYNYGVKIGASASFLLADMVELKGGLDYRNLWGVDTTSTYTVGITSFYVGVNVFFGSATGHKKKSSNNAPVNYQDDSVNSTQKYNNNDQSYNGSSDNAEDVVY